MELIDCVDFIKSGVEAIIDDDVTPRFDGEILDDWNFLTRTKKHYRKIPLKLKIVWILGVVFRYTILFPIRVIIFFVWVGQDR